MAQSAKIDTIEDLELNEKRGVVMGLRRKALVVDIPAHTDWSVMYAALEDAGIPAANSYLDNVNNPQLQLTDRDIKMVDKDKAEVVLTYGKFNDEGQQLYYSGVVTDRAVAGKMTTSVVQKSTNLYRFAGTGPQQLITLEHTYPADDEDFGGLTVEQSGTIDVQVPQRTFTIEGIKEVSAPWQMAERLIAAINKGVWLGQPKWTWMCTEVSWLYRTYANYYMTFTFQHNEDTWNPTAVFIDDRTKRPPKDLIEDVGYKQIRYFREVEFVNELGFHVIGPAQ